MSPLSITLWYHGTDVDSALALLNGMDLDPAEAAARKLDGPPGFFLAEEVDDAVFFGWRRQGTIVQVELSAAAYRQLEATGSVRRPIPHGFSATFKGEELFIPPDAFAHFNRLRASGEIVFRPVKWP